MLVRAAEPFALAAAAGLSVGRRVAVVAARGLRHGELKADRLVSHPEMCWTGRPYREQLRSAVGARS
ncbi:MAG: hypothetical protein U0S36_13485 [Candidatus Nanopelagicales bacterium]